MSNVALKWTGPGSQMFVGRDSFGHVTLAGSWPGEDAEWREWKAIKPSDMLLLSLAACSAYDVVMILGRQRQELLNLYIDVTGEQAPEPPYQFTHIHLYYKLEGKDLDSKKVERAIDLSQNKYCSVAATIRSVANLTHSYEIIQVNGG
jgi:putative redox protein